MNVKWLHMVAFALLVVGGVNWGLVGLLQMNLVESLFASMPGVVTWVYILIGVSAVYIAATHMNDCKYCASRGKKK